MRERREEPSGGVIALHLSLTRLLAGVVLAAAVALAARRAHALSSSGAVAAIGIGTTAVAAGWSWAILLLVYFVSSAGLTHFRASVKAARTDAVIAKGGPRDAAQVVANGFVFAVAAALSLITGWEGWRVLGAGAIAAAAADTWATEIGTLAGHAPRSILNWRPVPTGTSGGVSAAGLAAAVAGSAFIALVTVALGWPSQASSAAVVGGLAGSTIDSLFGATVQQRRWCDRCHSATERQTHRCGDRTRIVGGVSWMNNDMVNATSTLAGALLGLLTVR